MRSLLPSLDDSHESIDVTALGRIDVTALRGGMSGNVCQ